ncbi:dipeptide ABC transporter ATP-binding protein [Salinarimonas rosea]|uniref:dipeptide ABC transporter ATP-binding protein n=1 Tax=Salinarimonas rosea TaxID=552063 RepID=UPI00040B86A9|nr:ABC transporter ATP-binding protein [Salinarimonas rosea]
MLAVEGLTVEFPGRRGVLRAVEDVGLSVAPGEIHGLVGESGAGKSTIAAAITGLLPEPGRVAAGAIRLGETDLLALPPAARHAARGKRISMIFQDPQTSLNPLMTIEAQLVETILAHEPDLGDRAARARAAALLAETGIRDAERRMAAYPHQFSGGMRQRVAIALALCTRPELVVADEPTTALDVAVQSQVLALIRRLVDERGLGMVLITHDIGVIAQVTDRVTVLRHGRVVEAGPTGAVLGRPQAAYTRSLMASVPRLERRLDRFPLVAIDGAPAIVRPDAADAAERWLRAHRDATAAPPAAEALAVEGLRVAFDGPRRGLFRKGEPIRAVTDVSLALPRGSVLGLVGESGSGKSTLAKAIMGLVQPTGGTMRHDGAMLPPGRSRPRSHPARRAIQMVFQDPYSSLNARRRIGAILAEPLALYRIEPDAEARDRLARAMLALVGLPEDAAERYPHQFSGGQRQRIAIARALLARPDVLVCDEPTSALDVSIQAQVLNLLKDLQERFALSILFISHDLAVVRQMADRIAVMKDGRLVEAGESEAFFAGPRAEYSRTLLALTPSLALLEGAAAAAPSPAETAAVREM